MEANAAVLERLDADEGFHPIHVPDEGEVSLGNFDRGLGVSPLEGAVEGGVFLGYSVDLGLTDEPESLTVIYEDGLLGIGVIVHNGCWPLTLGTGERF